MDGFLVLRPATREELSARPPQYLLNELDRLAKLERDSLKELVDYINNLPMEVPAHIGPILASDAAEKEAAAVAAFRASPQRRQEEAKARAVATSIESTRPIKTVHPSDTSGEQRPAKPTKRLRRKGTPVEAAKPQALKMIMLAIAFWELLRSVAFLE